MLDVSTIGRLKKLLNPSQFRLIVILYNNTNEINEVKSYIDIQYPNSTTYLLQNSSTYQQVSRDIYTIEKGFLYIDNLDDFMQNKTLYAGFNQHRDKIAKHQINIISFYPNKLKSLLHRRASQIIPDLWEFRSPMVLLKERDTQSLSSINIDETLRRSGYSSLGGDTTKEKIEEIIRLKKRLANTQSKELQQNIINQLAKLYFEIGDYNNAKEYYLKELKTNEKLLGEEHPDTATSYNNLAELYRSMGAYEKAEPLHLKALKISEKLLGEEHPDTAASYNNLAGLYRSMGAYEKAEPLYLKALKIREKLLGEEHPDTAANYNNLAGLYESMGEYEKAELLYLKALEIHKKLLGEEHPSTATSYNLAGLYYDTEKYQKAYDSMQRAIKIREKVLPPEHPHLISARDGLKDIEQKLS